MFFQAFYSSQQQNVYKMSPESCGPTCLFSDNFHKVQKSLMMVLPTFLWGSQSDFWHVYNIFTDAAQKTK
jgi:hypothetical protein